VIKTQPQRFTGQIEHRGAQDHVVGNSGGNDSSKLLRAPDTHQFNAVHDNDPLLGQANAALKEQE